MKMFCDYIDYDDNIDENGKVFPLESILEKAQIQITIIVFKSNCVEE
jgi:hypothetical protein